MLLKSPQARAVQVWAQAADVSTPTVASSTTAQKGFFRNLFNAAKGLMWSDASDAVVTTVASEPATTFASPTASSTQARVEFIQAAQSKDVAKMNFSLRVLDDGFHVPVERRVYVEGSEIRLEARVQPGPSLFPKIFIDECYGTDRLHLNRARRAYIIVDNHGCLYAEEAGTAASWFRKEDSVIVFMLPAFLVTGELEEEIYIHCFLTAWSRRIPTNSGKKTCSWDSASSRWKNMDEPSQASVCNCCDTHCPSASHHSGLVPAFAGEGSRHRVVVGPLTVQKEGVPWFEGQCHTMKKLLLVSIAFVGSCILAALFVGTLLALALALFRYSRMGRGHQLLKDRKEQPFQTELQTVVGALAMAEAEATEKESSLDYVKLKSDTLEKV
ncbi:zona pellucida sperm-binding protein 3-like isoform X2 [Hemicordylus capensis]|uniref:zona pellucida sperm-binding protein 3-like isoform X2 n=1 Tax=Hemicordylus capensis TaxID=884348 RepID=UPI0023042D56|nr:zona pellucida sperm-binding protein 3-like isoform X2 [Hemicordylus capensis]